MLETARALEVFISAVCIDSNPGTEVDTGFLRLRFMGVDSASSSVFPLRASRQVTALSFSSHMTFSRASFHDLSDEIEREGENIAIDILLCKDGGETGSPYTIIGTSSINLWVMIEDSCGIVRQEIDIFSHSTGEESSNDRVIIGSLVVDVRGHYVLTECGGAVLDL